MFLLPVRKTIYKTMDDIDLIPIDPHRDAPLATEWINAPGGVKMLRLMGMIVPDDFRTTVTQEYERLYDIVRDQATIAWMIEYDGLVVGIIIVRTEPFEGLQAPNISIMIGDAPSRSKGIGTVAMEKAIEHMAALGHTTLYARALTDNAPSLGMLKKLGFIDEGEPYTDADKLHWQNVKLHLG